MPCVSQLPVFTLKKMTTVCLHSISQKNRYTYGALFLISEVTISFATILNGFFSCAECLIFYIYITPLVASLDPVDGQNLAPVEIHVSLSPLYRHMRYSEGPFPHQLISPDFVHQKQEIFSSSRFSDCFLYERRPHPPNKNRQHTALKKLWLRKMLGFHFSEGATKPTSTRWAFRADRYKWSCNPLINISINGLLQWVTGVIFTLLLKVVTTFLPGLGPTL